MCGGVCDLTFLSLGSWLIVYNGLARVARATTAAQASSLP